MQKFFLLFIIVFFCSYTSLEAQVIFEEDFEGGVLPASWTIQTNASDDGWNVGTVGQLSSQSFPIPSNGTANVIATNDDGCNCDKSNEYLITPSIDLTGLTAATLSFDAYYLDNTYQGNQEDATIEVSIDGGATWEVLQDLHGHGEWDRHTINVSAYVGQESVQFGFRYDDGSGWLYGFALDNVVVEVPPALEASLVHLLSINYGEVNAPIPLKGTVYNAGVSTITSLQLSYEVDGTTMFTEELDNLNIEGFSYGSFEISQAWVPSQAGTYNIEVRIEMVNGQSDENQDNNSNSFDTEIFEVVIVPDKIEDFILAAPVLTPIAGSSNQLDKPTDLDFFPILGKNELWVINQRNEQSGGSTLTLSNATNDNPEFLHRVDGNAWHFMSLPTAIAFSADNFNFATSPGVKDANHNGGTFTGPTLWSSDPDIYAQPSGGNGSHLDMLHGSPFSMGIAHEADNVFWVYDNWNKDIVRYDFAEDHGPGNADHEDGIVRRYSDIGINADGDIPNHMVLDKATGWLYFVDNGNSRVLRLDIISGTVSSSLANINEPLAEHSQMGGFSVEVIIEDGLEKPCGIEIFAGKLLVSDYANGDIVVYDMSNNFVEIGRIATQSQGITGIVVGPDGNIWYTNRIDNTLMKAVPGEVTSTNSYDHAQRIRIFPNPSTGKLYIDMSTLTLEGETVITLSNTSGQNLLSFDDVTSSMQLDLSHFSAGVYFLNIQNESLSIARKIVLKP